MGELHQYLTEFVDELQQLLKANQDDESLKTAIGKEWKGEDYCKDFLVGAEAELNPQGGRKNISRGMESIKDCEPTSDAEQIKKNKDKRKNIGVGKEP
ncbi:hypothetical protein QUF74_08570 [Candidatus Halobeggiatoa sp. HSG11]|nr:hypothetical protein [Candidatus Halobeggiatoa sp. HSG11]